MPVGDSAPGGGYRAGLRGDVRAAAAAAMRSAIPDGLAQMAHPAFDSLLALALQSGPPAGGGPAAASAGTFVNIPGAPPPHRYHYSNDPQGWRELTRAVGNDYLGSTMAPIFYRQIEQESGFDPAVVTGRRRSSAGAEGIAQLMPSSYPGVDRTDPEASLVAAAQTMRDYLERYGGDVRKALAAYNAGPGTVDGLVAARGSDWESGLPSETRRYLRSILGA